MTAHDKYYSDKGDLAMARFKRDEKENWGGFLNSIAREIAGRRDDVDIRLRHHKGRLVLIIKEKTQ